jgi:hypothetical protein
MLTINEMTERTSIPYKTIYARIKKGYPLSILLDEDKCAAFGEERYRNKRDKNFIQCVGEVSGLLTATEFVDNGKKSIAAKCECGEIVQFKSPSSFRIAKSCKSVLCTTKASLMTKDQNGTRYRTKIEVDEKVCVRCELVKPSYHFKKRLESVDGLHSHCKDCISQYPTSAIGYHRTYRFENKDHINAVNQESKKKRYALDPKYRIKDALAQRVRSAVTKGYKSASTMELVGCTIEFLKGYLEAQFETNMSWDNYGEWHIDHIIPCASFNLTEVGEQKKCFNYINLQPLWATTEIARSYGSDKIGNIEKNDR